MVILGQDIGLQRGEGQEFKRLIDIGSDIGHGNVLNLSTDIAIGGELFV